MRSIRSFVMLLRRRRLRLSAFGAIDRRAVLSTTWVGSRGVCALSSGTFGALGRREGEWKVSERVGEERDATGRERQRRADGRTPRAVGDASAPQRGGEKERAGQLRPILALAALPEKISGRDQVRVGALLRWDEPRHLCDAFDEVVLHLEAGGPDLSILGEKLCPAACRS